jgi:hypothetical protein
VHISIIDTSKIKVQGEHTLFCAQAVIQKNYQRRKKEFHPWLKYQDFIWIK